METDWLQLTATPTRTGWQVFFSDFRNVKTGESILNPIPHTTEPHLNKLL